MSASTGFPTKARGPMNSNAYDLSGRVAIVTGGGTGIGAATARLLAHYGADVVIASRTAEELEKTAAAVHDATGRRCVAVPTDVKEEEQVVRMVQRTMDEFGRIDILVNNAGGTRMGPLSGLTTKAWDASFGLTRALRISARVRWVAI
jgi:citronellol/citronellal dehydrogenase